MSRLTCELSIADDGRVQLRDLGSACGTFVSRNKVGGRRVTLREKDTIYVGGTFCDSSPDRLSAVLKMSAARVEIEDGLTGTNH